MNSWTLLSAEFPGGLGFRKEDWVIASSHTAARRSGWRSQGTCFDLHPVLHAMNGASTLLTATGNRHQQEMQKLEGCLRLKQEALDEDIFDLMVSRDAVWERLEEAEYLILNRDRELSAAMERESALREAVEIKDREINSMKVLLEMSNKSNNARYSNQSRQNRGHGEGNAGDLDHLKEEIDRQLVNIRRNLETGRVCLTEGMREICRSRIGQSEDCSSVASEAASECTMPTDEVDGLFFPYLSLNTGITESYGNSVEVSSIHDRLSNIHRPSWVDLQKMYFQLSETNMAFNQMVDVLQRTLDVLFLKMKQMIYTYETSLSEKCWEHKLVSGVLTTVLQCFMEELQEASGARTAHKMLNKQVISSNAQRFIVREANTCLGNGFKSSLCASADENLRKNLQGKKRDFEGVSSLEDEDQHRVSPMTGISSSCTSLENSRLGTLVHPPNAYLEHHNRVSSVTGMNSSYTSLENRCLGTLVCPPRLESLCQATHSVAMMIRNHESLIRRKMKEMSMEDMHWYKGEISRTEYSPLRRVTSSDAKRKRVLGIASRLDNNIMENTVTSTGQRVHSRFCKRDLLFRLNFPANEKLDSLDDVLDCPSNEVNLQDIAEIKCEMEEVDFQAMMTQEVFSVLLLKSVEEVNYQLHDQAILSFMKDDILGLVIKDIILNWDEEKDLDVNRKVEAGIKSTTESCLCKINYLGDSKREKILPQQTILKTMATEVYQPSPVLDTISKRSFCSSSGTDSDKERRELEQDREDGDFQTMVMKEVLLLLYGESVKEFGFHLEHGSILTLLIEDTLRLIVRWTLTNWDSLDSCDVENLSGTSETNNFSRKSDYWRYHATEKFLSKAQSRPEGNGEATSQRIHVVHNLNQVIPSRCDTSLSKEIRMLQQDKEATENHITTVKEIVVLLFRGCLEEMRYQVDDVVVLNLIKEDILTLAFMEVLVDWKNQISGSEPSNSGRYDNKKSSCLPRCFIPCDTLWPTDPDGICALPLVLENSISGDSVTSPLSEINFREKIRELKEDQIQSCSRTMIMSKVFGVLFREYTLELFIQLEEHVILGLMMEDVLKLALREMLIDWNCEKDFCTFGSLITGDVYLTIFREAIESIGCVVDAGLSISGTGSKCKSTVKCLPFCGCHAAYMHVGNDEIHKKVLNPLFKFIKRNHVMINDCRNTMEHHTDFGLGSQELKELNKQEIQNRDILDEKGSILGEHNERLQQALKPMLWNKIWMREFEPCLDVMLRDYGQKVITETVTECTKWTPCPYVDNEEKKENIQETVDVSTMNLSQMFLDLEHVVHEKLSIVSSRLEELNEQLHPLSERASTLRNREFVHRIAFKRRCCDLQKAEIEVDLLADEVDMLLRLFEKAYVALDYYSPVLQHYAGVMDIMNLIRRELTKEFTLL
ncbi:uncharacterized protein LOC116253361 isoform X1 [Nymphaea colorata]|uniref:uncharacterized protein LOC116253361 isoform X1 n=2 Tax=Nymphaea colorata TaxID=210225 RepID=UPI00214ED37F|nr:uncharacterized protein LOC116253361 isoform X1 [Nymphaea colorata]XP_031484003.2 uncharacterized protein LOC116253361 isoform X1 [Nymphaea colorata]